MLALIFLPMFIVVIALIITHASENEELIKSFKNKSANYENLSVQDKLWCYCHKHDLEIKYDGAKYTASKDSSFIGNNNSTWSVSELVDKYCRFSDLNVLLAAVEKMYGHIDSQKGVIISKKITPKKENMVEDYSFLLDDVEDESEKLMLKSVISRIHENQN